MELIQHLKSDNYGVNKIKYVYAAGKWNEKRILKARIGRFRE